MDPFRKEDVMLLNDDRLIQVCAVCAQASPSLCALGVELYRLLERMEKGVSDDEEPDEPPTDAELELADSIGRVRNRIRRHRDFSRALDHMRECETDSCSRLAIRPQYYCEECEYRAMLVTMDEKQSTAGMWESSMFSGRGERRTT